uniref:Dynein regulatory complex subunit 4 n=1 Tax=Cyclopterus lumpus TaxID=8103 RepID=A0A8C2ZC67_CYCLU
MNKTKPENIQKNKGTPNAVTQLEEHIVRLREELDREREERSYFQLERDKIQAFWEISKRRLEEEKAELRNRNREREEAEERHQVEITVYKQKLKHVLSEHHAMISGRKADAVAATTLVQNRHARSELGLQRELHGLQADFREKKLHNEKGFKELKLKHQVELMELANSCDKRIREMEVKYHENMQSTSAAESKKQRVVVADIEERMRSRVVTLVEDHDRALRRAEDYYSTVQKKLLLDQNTLKLQARVVQKLSAAEQENRRLSESLQEAQRKLPELQKRQQDSKQGRVGGARAAAAGVPEGEPSRRTVPPALSAPPGVSRCRSRQVQQERDELLRKQTETILDVQQRSGLKHLLLERKLSALTDAVEKKEAQLCAALSASNVDRTAGGRAANKLEEYDDLLQTCNEKLKDLGVPLYDFPFRPSERLLGRQTQVQDSPGPE